MARTIRHEDPYRSTLGRSYVPLQEQTDEARPRVLDAPRAATLELVVDRLIPGDEYWPAASATGAVRHIDGVLVRVPELRPSVLGLIDALEAVAGGFSSADSGARDAALRTVEADPVHASAFRAVYELACEAYYRHPSVLPVIRDRTGYDVTLPLRGVALEPFDASRLDRVRSLPPRYRTVSA